MLLSQLLTYLNTRTEGTHSDRFGLTKDIGIFLSLLVSPFFFLFFVHTQECESKIAQEIASLSKEDVSKEEMSENEEEVLNILLAQVRPKLCAMGWIQGKLSIHFLTS